MQLVSNAYRAASNSKCSFYSKMGFVVVQMDCRGSARRGLEFEGSLKHVRVCFIILFAMVFYLIEGGVKRVD